MSIYIENPPNESAEDDLCQFGVDYEDEDDDYDVYDERDDDSRDGCYDFTRK